MYAVSKNHLDKVLEVHQTNEYYLLHDNDTKYEKWEPPQDGLTSSLKKAHFGIINEKTNIMEVHSILALDDDKGDLEKRITDKDHPLRIKNSKRLSIDKSGTPSIPFSALKPYDRLIHSSKTESKAVVKKSKLSAKQSNAIDVVKSNNSKRKSDHDDEADTADKKAKPSENELDSEESEAESNFNSANGNKLNDFILDTCDGNCQMTQFFKSELANAHKKIADLEEEIRKLQEANRKTVENFSTQLADLNKTLKGKRESGHRRSTTTTENQKPFAHNLDGWSGACAVDGDDIPEGTIHFGDKVYVKISDISEKVESTSMDLRKRVRALLKLMFPDDVLKRALDVSKVKEFTGAVAVSPSNVTIMAMALSKMLWDGEVNTTRSNVSSDIRRELGYMRDKAKMQSLSPDELAQKKKEKAEKAKAKRAEKKLEKKKNNAISSSSSESEPEKK